MSRFFETTRARKKINQCLWHSVKDHKENHKIKVFINAHQRTNVYSNVQAKIPDYEYKVKITINLV